MFDTPPGQRTEFVHPDDVGLAVANAVTSEQVWGRTLLIGGGHTSQMYFRDFVGRMMEAMGKSHDELYAEIAANMALGVIPTDDECAKAALFLAWGLSVMVTGAGIDVNGGEVFH